MHAMTTPATHADLRAALEKALAQLKHVQFVHEVDCADEITAAEAALALPGDEVQLRVRWEEEKSGNLRLMLGPVPAGVVCRDESGIWWACANHQASDQDTCHDTRDAAREALVKAVGGEG